MIPPVITAIVIPYDWLCTKSWKEPIILYRTGGEEFNILLPGYDINRTRPVAEATFDAVKDLKIPYNEETLRVTISIGVSVLHERDHNPLDFYKRVDANLYHSKKNGRQQITIE